MKNSGQTGQSLVEVMIALSVLVVGFLGILSLLSQSFYLSKTISNETTATYLAAEGIEITKNILDHDMYEQLALAPGPDGWPKGLPDTTFGSGPNYTFEVDYTSAESCVSQSPCPLFPYQTTDFLGFDPTTHLYYYGGPDPTPFTREIKVTTDPNSNNDLTIDSIVYWNTGPLVQQQVDLEDVFYNWHP